MYNPYTDIMGLVNSQKASNKRTKDRLDSILKSNTDFYKSTFSDIKYNIGKTNEYAMGDKAYNDEGAKAIRAAYAISGKNASDSAAAEGAAENSGNLDSYAAAQANRARRDYITAGEEAVGKRAEKIFDVLTSADKNLVTAFGTVANAISDSGSQSQKLQSGNAGNDSDLLASAIKTLASLYSSSVGD